MNFDAVFTVKNEISKEQFLRALLVKLGLDMEAPADVVNAEFGEIEESYKETILCTAFVSGICTASIGYDRQETYVDYVTKKEKVGDSYVEYKEPVTKTRTVTDWRPFNTEFSGKSTKAVENDSIGVYDAEFTRALRTAADSSIVEEGEAIVNKAALDRVIRECQFHVKHNNLTLPGDRQRDESVQYTHEIESLYCYRLPHYKVTYIYNGKEYSASCIACGELHVRYSNPEIVEEPVAKVKARIEEKAKQLTADQEKTTKTVWLAFFSALGAAALACFVLRFAWLWPVVIGVLAFACYTNYKYNNAYTRYTDSFAMEYAKEKSQGQASLLKAKIENVNLVLAAMGYNTLSDEETPELDAGSDTVIQKNRPEITPPKSFLKKAVLSGVLAIALVISSFVIHGKVQHDPKHVNVNIVEKTVEFRADEGMYGKYYIHLDFEVEPERVGVEYVSVKVFVSDEDGEELGTINASISGKDIEAGDKRKVTISLNEYRPENNQFFTILYTTDLEDLQFEYQIESIRFIDGKNYYGKD